MGSRGNNFSRHTSSRVKPVLNKCSMRDFVVIDLDSDVPNVIIVDVEESVQKKLRKPSPRTVITIDDDDEVEDEAGSNDNASTSESSSKPCVNPVQPKENGSGNRYGFGSECESKSTESDCSDCECMEGPAEELRYQWEQASKKRKTNVNTGAPCYNQASTSAPSPDFRFVPGKENVTTQPCSSKQSSPTHIRNWKGKHFEGKIFGESDLGSSAKNDVSDDPFDDFSWNFASHSPTIPDFMKTGSSSRGNNSTKYAGKPHYVDVDPPSSSFCENKHGPQEPLSDIARSFYAPKLSSPSNPDAMRTGSSSMGKSSTRYAEKPHSGNVDPHSSVFREDEHGSQEPALFTNDWNDNLNSSSEQRETKVSNEPCLDKCQQSFAEQFDSDILETSNEDPAVPKSKLSDDSDCESDRVASMDVDEELPTTGSFSNHVCRTSNSSNELNSAAASFGNFKPTNKVDRAEKTIPHCREPVQMEPYGSNCLNGLASNEAKDVSQDVGVKLSQNDVLTDRQKIKETDVYKRAMEEEEAGRQRQRQIEAEEAQRQRKRKRAEKMRIIDMERRQKQRVEEMRETQKKDEENLNTKETLRAEVRKKLNKLEGSCRDMASLLRKLGVHVGGNMHPSITEVQAAYKKAMLKFHPDRASRTDMRQQVEAEEKFKLITRMKEKYLPA